MKTATMNVQDVMAQLEGWGSPNTRKLFAQHGAEILSAPYRKQEAMNICLVETGIHIPAFSRKCIDLGEGLGRFDKRPVPKGCVSTYAPEWIAAALKRKR